MLIYLTTRIICSVGAFFYPGYASYKVLSQRPAPELELERWLMYWCVLGCIIGVEYVAEWLVSWIPFYYTTKTIFLLYLALPQTQGASYLYIVHLDPFLHAHEREIDTALAQMKVRAYAFVQTRARAVWEAVAGTVLAGAPAAAGARTDETGNGPAQALFGLWQSFAPGMVASGAAMLQQVSAPAGSATVRERAGHRRNESVMDRKRRLEAELAALGRDDEGETKRSTSRVSSFSGSDTTDGQRRTGSSSGRFEEVDVPSDLEGYDVGGEVKRASWFGWGAK